jgi:hypothetical protein
MFARQKPARLLVLWILKGILKDRAFHSIDEIDNEITEIWNALSFNEVQSVFPSRMKGLAWVTENGGEHIRESERFRQLKSPESVNQRGSFFTPVFISLTINFLS